jgi:hypothetical protein
MCLRASNRSLRDSLRQVLTVDPDFSAGRTQLRAHHAQQRGLATPGRPHDAGDLAARDADIDVIENAARTALEGDSLQLDRVGVIGTHLNSLRCSLSLGRLAFLIQHMYIPGRPNWRRTISLQTPSAQGLCRAEFSYLTGLEGLLRGFGYEE